MKCITYEGNSGYYIGHRVDIWMVEKIQNHDFSKGRALTLDKSIQGRLEVGKEVDLKIWVKFRCEKLEGRKHNMYSRNM